jgi:hypothetical protein
MKNKNLINEVTRIREMMGVKILSEGPMSKMGIEAFLKFLGKTVEKDEAAALKMALEDSLDTMLKKADRETAEKLEKIGVTSLEGLEKNINSQEVKSIESELVQKALQNLEDLGMGNLVRQYEKIGGELSDSYLNFLDMIKVVGERFKIDASSGQRLGDTGIAKAEKAIEQVEKMKSQIGDLNISKSEKDMLFQQADKEIAEIQKSIKLSRGIEDAAETTIESGIEDNIMPTEEEVEGMYRSLSTNELVSQKITNMTPNDLKMTGREWFTKLKNKDITKLTEEEMSWFLQLSEKGVWTPDELKLLSLDSPSIKETADFMKMWQEYDKKYANFRDQQNLPTFEKFLNSKGFKKPVGWNKFMGRSLKFVRDLGKHWSYCFTNLGEMGTKQWWKSFMNVCMHGAVLFGGAIPFIYNTSGRIVDKGVEALNDLTPFSSEEITKFVTEFFNYNDPKIDGISIYGSKDAAANAKLRDTPPVVTVLSSKLGTIKLTPGVSVDGVMHDTFKFEPSHAPIVAGNEKMTPHTMTTISSTPPITPATGTVEASESELKTFINTKFTHPPSAAEWAEWKFTIDSSDKSIITANNSSKGLTIVAQKQADGTYNEKKSDGSFKPFDIK